MNKKILLGLIAANAYAAQVTTMIGANLEASLMNLSLKSDGLVNFNKSVAGTTVAAIGNKAYSTAGVDVTDSKTSLKDPKKVYPLSGSLVGRVIIGEEFKFGLGMSVGGRYNANLPTDRYFGATDGKAEAANPTNLPIAFKYAQGNLVLNPHFLLCFDVSDIKIMLALGLDMVYNKVTVDYAKGTALTNAIGGSTLAKSVEVKNWLFGIKVGVEGIYNVTPCVGFGAGLAFTYLPKAFNKMDQKGKKAVITGATDTSKKEEVLNLGGTWALTLNLAAYITPSANV